MTGSHRALLKAWWLLTSHKLQAFEACLSADYVMKFSVSEYAGFPNRMPKWQGLFSVRVGRQLLTISSCLAGLSGNIGV